jgi:hypothetical protein
MANEFRRQYADLLMTKIEEADYPSIELMNRLESVLGEREQAEEYAQVLFEKIGGDQYPSLQMLDRVDRLVRLLD